MKYKRRPPYLSSPFHLFPTSYSSIFHDETFIRLFPFSVKAKRDGPLTLTQRTNSRSVNV